MDDSKKLVTFRLTSDSLEETQNLRKDYGSQSGVIRHAVSKYLANHNLAPIAMKYDFLNDNEFRIEYDGVYGRDGDQHKTLGKIVHRAENGNIDIYEPADSTVGKHVNRFIDGDQDLAAASVNPERRKVEYVKWVDQEELPEPIQDAVENLHLGL